MFMISVRWWQVCEGACFFIRPFFKHADKVQDASCIAIEFVWCCRGYCRRAGCCGCHDCCRVGGTPVVSVVGGNTSRAAPVSTDWYRRFTLAGIEYILARFAALNHAMSLNFDWARNFQPIAVVSIGKAMEDFETKAKKCIPVNLLIVKKENTMTLVYTPAAKAGYAWIFYFHAPEAQASLSTNDETKTLDEVDLHTFVKLYDAGHSNNADKYTAENATDKVKKKFFAAIQAKRGLETGSVEPSPYMTFRPGQRVMTSNKTDGAGLTFALLAQLRTMTSYVITEPLDVSNGKLVRYFKQIGFVVE